MKTDGRTDELAVECVEQLRSILAMSPCEWYLPARRALAAYDAAREQGAWSERGWRSFCGYCRSAHCECGRQDPHLHYPAVPDSATHACDDQDRRA